jgi:hypothetical protein
MYKYASLEFLAPLFIRSRDAGTTSVTNFVTREFYRYEPSKQLQYSAGIIINNIADGVTKRWGLFNENNGIFFQLTNGNEFSVIIRSNNSGSVIENKVVQENFNLDTIDGNGTSLYNIDFNKIQVYYISFQWYGAGNVIFGVQSEKGKIIEIHRFSHVNELTDTYTATGILPMNFEIETTNSSEESIMRIFGNAINILGGEDPPTLQFSASSNVINLNNTNETILFAIRMASTPNSSNPNPNRTIAFINSLFYSQQSDDAIIYRVYSGISSNTSISGGTWNRVGTLSAVEVNKSPTNFDNSNDQIMFERAFVSNDGSDELGNNRANYKMARNYDNSDSIVYYITAEKLTSRGGDREVISGMNWSEI